MWPPHKGHLRPMASTRTEMVVRRGRQKKMRQEVTVEIRACPLRLTYDTGVRRESEESKLRKSSGLSKWKS